MTPIQADTMQSTTTANTPPLSSPCKLWAVYGICLLISAVYFFLFGFNSPIYTFNSDHDYNWFITMGHGLVAGKLPYRDLFEHKGPIVYFVTAFCCLFKSPNIIMLLLEIINMSLFFFFVYRIAHKRLNNIYALIAILISAVTIFTCWIYLRSAATVEEFALPIYAYFLLCWLEFLLEKRHWTYARALCLGLCFGVLFWIKFTLLYFMLIPMITWFVLSLRRRQYRIVIVNLCLMLAGVIMISLPNIVFYAANHALSDLFHVYFVINLTAYGTTDLLAVLGSFGLAFAVGPLLLFFILWGVVRFAIHHWQESAGRLLLISYLVTLALLIWSSKTIYYYYAELVPYAILGIVDILVLVQAKLKLPKHRELFFVTIAAVCAIICIPFSILTYEWGRNKDSYTPLVIADVIHIYEEEHQTQATLFCYKILDYGFYNAAGIVPNNYYFARNSFSADRLPEMYAAYNTYITEQTSDFLITDWKTWETEKDYLSQYYAPYFGDIEQSTFHYRQVHYFYYKYHTFVLLFKI